MYYRKSGGDNSNNYYSNDGGRPSKVGVSYPSS